MGAAVFNGKLHVIGGMNSNDTCISSVYVYDPKENSWSKLAIQNLNQAWCVACASVFDGTIYITGGTGSISDPTNIFDSVEILNMTTNSWLLLDKWMPSKRGAHRIGVISDELYVFGGFIGETASYLSSVVKLKRLTGEWLTQVASMNIERASHGFAVLNGMLYAIGGHHSIHGSLKSAEVYNPASNRWSFVANMTEAQVGLSAVAYNGFIYAIGGFQFDTTTRVLNTMEVYNPRNNTWTISQTRLTYGP